MTRRAVRAGVWWVLAGFVLAWWLARHGAPRAAVAAAANPFTPP